MARIGLRCPSRRLVSASGDSSFSIPAFPNFWFAVLAAIIAAPLSRSAAQAAASSASSSIFAPAAVASKPAKPIKPADPANKSPKHFIELYNLTDSAGTFKFGANSCFSGALRFPVVNATEVAKLLSTEKDFTLTAVPPDKIAVYYKSVTLPLFDQQRIEQQMRALARPDFDTVTAIRVPPGSADKTPTQLALPQDGSIVAKAVGSNCILVVSKAQSDPLVLTALTKSIQGLYWRQPSAPPTQRLFYVDATAVAKKLSGASSSSESSTASDKPTSKSKGSSSDTGSVSASSTAAPTVSVSVAPGAPSTSSKATATDSDVDSSSSGDEPETANAYSDSKDTGVSKSPSTDKIKSKAPPTPTPKPLIMQPVNDILVYTNEDGSDRGIFERNRLMAVLDLPRPEVLMNIWSLQASSSDSKIVTSEAEAARELIAHHNDLLQQAIDEGWNSLSQQMTTTGFFNDLFYRYVTRKFGQTDFETEAFVSSSMGHSDSPTIESQSARKGHPSGNQQASSREGEKKTISDLEAVVVLNRKSWGWCDSGQYCLGFSSAFEPLRPTFTNILIGIIAADKPYTAAQTIIDAMERKLILPSAGCNPSTSENDPCANEDTVKRFRSCMRAVDKQLHTFAAQSVKDCELIDRVGESEQILAGLDERFQLNCFRGQTKQSFGPVVEENTKKYATTRAGLMRSAVADFLFNYKWATQYPHDFVAYDLTQSAQELNAEFNPLVLAFNRDVSAFTENLQAELQCKYEADISHRESKNWLKSNDATFINDGMLSVRGISGVESLVDTVTQSFFDATNPPSLTDLVKSISDAEQNVPGVLKSNLSANEAAVLLGALNSVQPAEAKIGRELKLDITPHALAGASSAELEVKLTAEEAGNPTRFTSGKSAEDTLSRIAKHDVSTRVRVESLKLFEVSAFSAMLQRPRSKFPILPPFFEVPYFGSFLSWPLPGAKVYHRSTAIVSAVIVPTAADLAFGIDFGADRLCDEEGCHRAKSPRDFGNLPLRNFHKAMVECFASSGITPYTGLLNDSGAKQGCTNLSLVQQNQGGLPLTGGRPTGTVPPE
jgi:hypothetical protein